ncbi:octanoyltransferase [Candidatus Woesearchaeota archaeon]|jgi:lipoate-protein ligase A|nr:octanoyltransferase [Candidatus Woesearchaeota archaeon]|tara:strand:- start:4464 stop:5288 length:825 start_codon:yes stop_codon:yes gene_type:complete
MEFRVIHTGKNSAFTNMAIDEAILTHCQIPTLRLYQWQPSISIGYNQDANNEININKSKRYKIPIVRRITGGKAILHDKELTYSFILPQDSLSLPQSIAESYRIIAKALVNAFGIIGIKAELKKQPEKISTPICFNSSNWYELLVNNKKISGSAQRRLNGMILQHGSLLIDFDYEKNASLFKSSQIIDNTESLKKRITSIKKELNKDISYKELAAAVILGFQRNFNMQYYNDPLTHEELKLANKLSHEKYSTDSWNLSKNDATKTEKLINTLNF